ncbi:hypothetical protein C1645_791923 [Glomus cerebriforme]|uniref:DUF202 domain-containing protein n=1 Tax=Glomus cerebriforme TaxID=658196 RepID=A0A397S9S4_9GLOM|nr:hypothetical protein C1645_791923 [Glomus cerebriforme]
MPSAKPGNIKITQQPQTRLVNRRSFGSADANFSTYGLDNVIENPDYVNVNNNDDRKNKGILNNNPQSMGGDNQQQSNSNNNNNSNPISKSWWDPSLKLENKASVARDHLANERTFLAWLRTSLSFISIGVAITQLFRLNRSDQRANEYDKSGKFLGIVFIILGIVFLSFGITRYFHSQYLMTKGYFPASRGSVVIGTMLTILVLAACFIVIITSGK